MGTSNKMQCLAVHVVHAVNGQCTCVSRDDTAVRSYALLSRLPDRSKEKGETSECSSASQNRPFRTASA